MTYKTDFVFENNFLQVSPMGLTNKLCILHSNSSVSNNNNVSIKYSQCLLTEVIRKNYK